MTDGWDASAPAWIAAMGDQGDYGRVFVLDPPMLERIDARSVRAALDVGCGEGRFCRILRARGITAIGVDPTEGLIRQAAALDREGEYRIGRAEMLDFPAGAFDLVVSYLTLIDIAGIETAIAEMARVLCPGGILLIASLNSFHTASVDGGWKKGENGEREFHIDHYLDERAAWACWDRIRVQNWHRPLSRYMSLLLGQGLMLRYFDEPSPRGGDPDKAARYRRVPYFVVMEWEKPGV